MSQPSLDSPAQAQTRWSRIAAGVCALLALLAACLLLIGIEIDAEPYRRPLSSLLSKQLGRELQLQGDATLRLGLRPALRVRDLRIRQPAGFHGQDFLRVGELQVRLDLLPLLAGRLRADHVSARDVMLELIEHGDGRNNWTSGDSAPETRIDPETADTRAAALSAIDIRRLALERLQVRYHDGEGPPLQLMLNSLEASAPAEGRLVLRASGKVGQRLDYALRVDGGSWQHLVSGRPGWPLALTLDVAGGRLSVQGKLGETDSQLRFGLGAPDLAAFGKLLGVPLPDAGHAGLSGALRVRPASISLSDLSGTLGKSTLSGSLDLDLRHQRPRLSGALRFGALDLRPLLGQDSEQDPPTDWHALYRSLSLARVDLSGLRQLDADLRLSVGQWLSLPGRIDHASLSLKLQDGRLSVPIEASVEGVPMKGRLEADGSAALPALRAAFSAQQAEVGGLARLLTGLPGIEGKLGRLQMSMAARGADGSALMRSLSIDTELSNSRLSYGNDQGKPVAFGIERLVMEVSGSQPLSGSLRGTLLGKPLQVELAGESLMSALDKGTSPLSLTLQSGNVAGRFLGVIDGTRQRADFSFSLGAGRAGDIAAWLGLRADATLPIALAGRLRGTPQKWSLSQLVLQVGESSAYADIDQEHRNGQSHLSVLVDIASVDGAQLDTLLEPSPAPRGGTRKAATLDIPVLPTRLVLDDADLRVRARDVRGTQLALGDMGFDGRVRNGYMQSSPFFANVSGTRYEGAVMLDLRDEQPHAQLWLSAADVDVGELARQLKLARQLDARIERLSVYLDTHASQLSALVANATLQGEASGGRLAWRDPNTGARLKAGLERATLSARPGERLALQVQASVDDIPIRATLRSATAKDLADPNRRIPFDLALEGAGAALKLSGSMDRDIETRDIALALDVRGQSLNSLDKLMHVSLPPWGPWSVLGRFRMSRDGYAVDDMQLKVGSSALNGRGTMDTRSGRAKLDVSLAAPLVQLDDFRLAGWSAFGEDKLRQRGKAQDKAQDNAQGKPGGDNAEAIRRKAVETSDQVQALLSPQALRQADATLSVRVEQVLSGKDRLGQGQLSAKLANGRAEIGPVLVEMPGGQARMHLAYEPRDKDIRAQLMLDIDNFDYGVLGRRLKPDSPLDGRFSLKMEVASQAPRLSQMLAHGDGRIEFAVWPRDLRAGVFDLWAVNLLVALLPTVDPKHESTVNCAVGRFALNDGKLVQKQLVIDTSRMRVSGVTSVDFGTERVHMRLQPQAKSAQFLSLATPIEVRGSFTDYAIGPNPGDVIETAVRLATSIVWVPIKRLFSEKVPTDGSDVCAIALQ